MNSPPVSAWPSLFRDVYSGRSIGRALMHLKVGEDLLETRGVVVDIGGGRRQTYLRCGRRVANRVVTIDTEPRPGVDVVATVTDLPMDRKCIDVVLCFNVLEHVYDHKAALSEIGRVMKSDGTLYGWVPFIIGIHGAPDDFFRYTPSSLERLLWESGLEPTCVECCGNVFLSAFDLVRPHIRGWFVGRVLRTLGLAVALVSYQAFGLASRLAGHAPQAIDPCPSGIWFTARARVAN